LSAGADERSDHQGAWNARNGAADQCGEDRGRRREVRCTTDDRWPNDVVLELLTR